jgi:hypothetical protein
LGFGLWDVADGTFRVEVVLLLNSAQSPWPLSNPKRSVTLPPIYAQSLTHIQSHSTQNMIVLIQNHSLQKLTIVYSLIISSPPGGETAVSAEDRRSAIFQGSRPFFRHLKADWWSAPFGTVLAVLY